MDVLFRSTVARPGVSAQWVKKQICAIGKELQVVPGARVAVVCVGEAKMKTLHGAYSGEPTVTDVLSFPAGESYDAVWQGKEDEQELGEIVLCVPQIARQAKQAGHSYQTEMNTMFAHGMLHLLGYDHQNPKEKTEMYTLQDQLVYTIEQRKSHES